MRGMGSSADPGVRSAVMIQQLHFSLLYFHLLESETLKDVYQAHRFTYSVVA